MFRDILKNDQEKATHIADMYCMYITDDVMPKALEFLLLTHFLTEPEATKKRTESVVKGTMNSTYDDFHEFCANQEEFMDVMLSENLSISDVDWEEATKESRVKMEELIDIYIDGFYRSGSPFSGNV